MTTDDSPGDRSMNGAANLVVSEAADMHLTLARSVNNCNLLEGVAGPAGSRNSSVFGQRQMSSLLHCLLLCRLLNQRIRLRDSRPHHHKVNTFTMSLSGAWILRVGGLDP